MSIRVYTTARARNGKMAVISTASVLMLTQDCIDVVTGKSNLWLLKPELQIRGGMEDNSNFFFYFLTKTYVVTPH